MKKICILLVLGWLVSTFNLSAQTTHPNFIMFWYFVNSTGADTLTNLEACEGGTLYLLNSSTSDGYGIGSSLNTGYYSVYDYTLPYVITNIPAGDWYEGEIHPVTLPAGINITNIRVKHFGPGTSPAFTSPYPSEQFTRNMVTHFLTVDAGPDTTVCPFTSVILEGTGTGTSFNWSPSGGSNNPTLPIFFGSTTVNTLTTSKNYSTTSQGILTCTASDQMTVFVNPAPSIHLDDYELCDGDPLPILDGGPSPVAYEWKYTPTGLITDTTVGFGQFLNTDDFGYGTYQLIVYNSYGCSSTDFASVELSSSAASNINPNFDFYTNNDATTTQIDVYSPETIGTHHWMLFLSDASGNIGLYPIEQITTASNTHSFSPQPLNQFYKIVHDYKVAPCDNWTSYSRLTYQSSKIINVWPNPVRINKKFFMKVKDKNITNGTISIIDLATRRTVFSSKLAYGQMIQTSLNQASTYVIQYRYNSSLYTETLIVR